MLNDSLEQQKKLSPKGITALLMLFATYYLFTKNPFARASFKLAEIPFLLIVLKADVETFKVIHLSSSGI